MSKMDQESFFLRKNAAKSKLGGFTLIELLVVVLIIGILAAIALPQYEKAVGRSRSAEALSKLKTLAQAAEVYRLETGSWPTDFSQLSIQIPGEEIASNRIKGEYYYILINDRVDVTSIDGLRQPSFLYISDVAQYNPQPGKHYYCYYVLQNDGKDDIRENLCRMSASGEKDTTNSPSIWFAMD